MSGVLDSAWQKHSQAMKRLSLREREIVDLLIRGLDNKAIAESANLTVNTVEWHLKNIYRKLKNHSRGQATVKILMQDEVNLVIRLYEYINHVQFLLLTHPLPTDFRGFRLLIRWCKNGN